MLRLVNEIKSLELKKILFTDEWKNFKNSIFVQNEDAKSYLLGMSRIHMTNMDHINSPSKGLKIC